MTDQIPRWNPCLPVLPPETPDRARIQGALWRHWYADLQAQRIARAVTMFPFPLIDMKTGKAVQIAVEEPDPEELEWVSVGSDGNAVDNLGRKVEVLQAAHDKAQAVDA